MQSHRKTLHVTGRETVAAIKKSAIEDERNEEFNGSSV